MHLGKQLAVGKTKIVFAHSDDSTLVVLQHKDGITAGDGARRAVIPGKGVLAGRTTANVFALLNRAGVATHFVAAPEPNLTIVRRCVMIPLEVVMRRLATGSYLRRHPSAAEGTRFDPPLVEFFLKDDQHHDPQITEQEIIDQQLATAQEVAAMAALGRQVFAILEQAWNAQEVTLADLKIEFGRPWAAASQSSASETASAAVDAQSTSPELIVADVIDNDSWRIWPGGEKSRMLDKQVYRNAQEVDDELLKDIHSRYALVADMTSLFQDYEISQK
ncbi:MAG: phosphoribosylaminoimidazolesuccinocarboxamide synthase [Chloroflexales bacterium]|nr:phosphoribosylaminoimidazolesuccinocarboxamide synthase [Chloroflexales bacterium]